MHGVFQCRPSGFAPSIAVGDMRTKQARALSVRVPGLLANRTLENANGATWLEWSECINKRGGCELEELGSDMAGHTHLKSCMGSFNIDLVASHHPLRWAVYVPSELDLY
jgi:hypothetical protein